MQYFDIADYKLKGYTDWDDDKTIKKYLKEVPDIKNKPKPEDNQNKNLYAPINCDDIEFLDDE